MQMQTTVETLSEVIYNYGDNLALNSTMEGVTITYQNAGAQDKPYGIRLDARDTNGNRVSIALKAPKKPWNAPVGPEGYDLLIKLLNDKKFDEINKQFLIEKIL